MEVYKFKNIEDIYSQKPLFTFDGDVVNDYLYKFIKGNFSSKEEQHKFQKITQKPHFKYLGTWLDGSAQRVKQTNLITTKTIPKLIAEIDIFLENKELILENFKPQEFTENNQGKDSKKVLINFLINFKDVLTQNQDKGLFVLGD